MPKLTRKTQKIFCGNADNDQLAVFGSMATGSPVYTDDIEQLQGNTAYGEGWEAATLEDKAPFMEEMNGIQYSTSYQLAYLLQQGIAEWDSNTTYYTHSFVSFNDGNIYQSLQDNNIGNNPSSSATYWKQLNLNAANTDLSNLSATGEKHFLNKSQITNCLLEVPQKIKLELVDGVLTLKAGSEVIVPNGFEADGTTPKFDYVTVASDCSWQASTTAGTRLGFYDSEGGNLVGSVKTYMYSGNTATMNSTSAVTYGRFYNTETNKIYVGNSNGGSWVEVHNSLPVCLFTNDSTGAITSLDQVFNGMGYIGSTVWVDKGVKGLIPNGRNEDGTLNNIEAHTETVLTYTNKTARQKWFSFTTPANGVWTKIDYISHGSLTAGEWVYNEQNNTWSFMGNIQPWFPFADSTIDSSSPYAITSLKPKQPFRAVDYNDFQELKSSVINKVAPNWDAKISVSSLPYTAPSYGWWCHYGINKNGTIAINGVNIDRYSFASNNWPGHQAVQILLSPNDKVTIVSGEAPEYKMFIPCKGVN